MSIRKLLLWITETVLAAVVLLAIAFLFRPVGLSLRAVYLREALHGIGSHRLQVADHSLHYLVDGPADGRPIVLVHGLGGSAEDWLELEPVLARSGFRVYMPDLLGYGRSDRPADFSYSVRDQAALVAAFLDALQLRQVDLAGWSMGGWIAQLVAVKHPGRIRRLVLFDSVGLRVPPTWDTRLFTPTTPQELDQLEALLMPAPPAIPSFVARDVLRTSAERAWIIQRSVASMLTGADTTDALLPHIQIPVLLVWGDQDRITPPSLADAMHHLLPHSELSIAAGCGHLAPRQCTSQVAPRLLAFLRHD